MLGSNELILNHITTGEKYPPFDKTFEDYKEVAYKFLMHKGKYLFAQDILNQYGDGANLEKIFEQNKHRYLPGLNREKEGVRQKTWYDIWGMDEIERNDHFFDYFFILRLRHLTLLEIDGFLEFHLDYSFKNQKREYFRWLQLTLRTYGEDYLNGHITETVNEWIKANEATENVELTGTDKEEKKIKGRMQREAGDQLTCLNVKQTALLIEYLQKAGIILKSENLTDTHAGKAFNILTGFSSNTLRMALGKQGTIEGAKHEDYKELLEAVRRLAGFIEADTRKK